MGKSYSPLPAFQAGHPKRPRNYCCDQEGCKNAPDAPMMKHEVWGTISHRQGLLCIEHAQERLGRRITMDDLMPSLVNQFTLYLQDNPL